MKSGAGTLFVTIYGQIAAVLGAISYLVFFGHFFDFGLKGIVREFADWWAQFVRPLLGIPLEWLVSHLPESWRFEVPVLAMDYFAVGVVSVLSFHRAFVGPGEGILDLLRDFRHPSVVVGFFLILFAWPLVPLLLLASSEEDRAEVKGLYQGLGLWAAPIVYLAMMLAINAWLL